MISQAQSPHRDKPALLLSSYTEKTNLVLVIWDFFFDVALSLPIT
jgi:hypothetical protein